MDSGWPACHGPVPRNGGPGAPGPAHRGSLTRRDRGAKRRDSSGTGRARRWSELRAGPRHARRDPETARGPPRFRQSLPPDLAGPLEAGLKRLAAALGVVRDLDVHAERVARDAASLEVADNPAVVEYLRRLDRGRGEAQRRLARELTRRVLPPWRGAWTKPPPGFPRPAAGPRVRPPRNVPSPGACPAVLPEVRRDGGRVRPNSPDASFHRLRIRCKRLRYACEFLRPAIGPTPARMPRAGPPSGGSRPPP